MNRFPTQENLTQSALVSLLQSTGKKREELFALSSKIKEKYIGKKVYLRGLIEFTNYCKKDCYYCGIRRSNSAVKHFDIEDKAILEAAHFAYTHNYASLALQSGELKSEAFSRRVTRLLEAISELSGGTLGVTLSCGEQDEETYRRWFEAGAQRYLLRIETSNEKLYKKLHPNDDNHLFSRRLEALDSLKKVGYQVGTGVMIGLPFQTMEDLAADLLFMQKIDIDMCGMGPYIEHPQTPLAAYSEQVLPLQARLDLSLKMLALLRILMPDINIAATTALQAIDEQAREKAVSVGANVLMPNITPGKFRNDYNLYSNKPQSHSEDFGEGAEHPHTNRFGNAEIIYGKQGNSPHFKRRKGRDGDELRSLE